MNAIKDLGGFPIEDWFNNSGGQLSVCLGLVFSEVESIRDDGIEENFIQVRFFANGVPREELFPVDLRTFKTETYTFLEDVLINFYYWVAQMGWEPTVSITAHDLVEHFVGAVAYERVKDRVRYIGNAGKECDT